MKRVVIIGGGFAGSLIARRLEKHFNVLLIDSKDYFEFTPGILRTIVEPEHIRKVQVMHSHYLERAKILHGNVSKVENGSVSLNGKKIKFDYLVIASGSSYAVPIKESNLIIAARAAHLRKYYGRLCKANSVLIIGGGLVGVELAAEIATHYKKKVMIVHSKNKLIERNPLKASKYAEKFLKKIGVSVLYNERIVSSKNSVYFSDKNNRYKADLAFVCTGIKPNTEFLKKSLKKSVDEDNFLIVNKNMQVLNQKRIFAAGDVTNCKVEKTAQNAERQARIVVKNILALENEDKMTAYMCRKSPLVISLGKYNGMFVYKDFVFTGLIPALMKGVIEKKEMIKLKCY